MAECRGCGARIHFVKTSAKKWMPCEPTPHEWDDIPDGEVALCEETGVTKIKSAQSGEEQGTWYLPHFKRCPKADQFRKG